MAELINFNKVRKAKARADAERQAAENRVKFGRTKAQRQLDAARAADDAAKLDRLRREPPEPSSGDID